MKQAYNSSFNPPVPILAIRLSAPDENPAGDLLNAIVDTGADGTLVPSSYLEQAGAIGVGDAILRGVLGEAREVHFFEVDLHIESLTIPGVLAAADDLGTEVLLGRNVLNKLILLLDGRAGQTETFETRPTWH
jgi:predicted aspartyl protease